jgi:hypothetical protein
MISLLVAVDEMGGRIDDLERSISELMEQVRRDIAGRATTCIFIWTDMDGELIILRCYCGYY